MPRLPDSDDDVKAKVTEEWLTKVEVAKKLGKSLAAVTRYTKVGRLNPVVVDNTNKYDPQEVAELLADPEITSDDRDRGKAFRREDFLEYQLDTVKALIGLVREPREKIDQVQFDIIDRQAKRIVELEAQVEAGRKAREDALDQSAERAAALQMLKGDQDIKKLAAERIMITLGKLISGPDGVKFTPEQLEQLVLANGDGEEQFLTSEQLKQAKEIIAKHKASTNGKQTVSAVAKTVVDATGTAKHD